jgi:hypothetical protein
MKWMCFISHHQEAITGFAKTLQMLLESELERRQVSPSKVWLDMTEHANKQGMHDGIRSSEYFIMFMSEKMLTPRPNGQNWCIQEVQWALQHRKPIIIVFQTNPNWGGVPGSFSHFYRKEIERVFPADDDRTWILSNTYTEYHHRGEFDQAMLRRILREMPKASRPSHCESSRESSAQHDADHQSHRSSSRQSSAPGVAHGQVRASTLKAAHALGLTHARVSLFTLRTQA